jgi:hypothetical protein
MLRQLVLAEVRPLEQLGDQDDAGALRGGVSHQALGGRDVRVEVVTHRHLQGSNPDRRSSPETLLVTARRRRLSDRFRSLSRR